MKRNSIAIAAVALGLAAIGVSCSSKDKKAEGDTMLVEEATVAQEPAEALDSLAQVFRNPERAFEIATDSTYAETPTGLRYMVVREGTGKSPAPDDEVTVNYEGKFLNGTVFDSSYGRGEPATFPLNRVIPGWTEGLQLMKEGGKAIFYIPSDLAYGPQGYPGSIPPNSDLIFTVELIKVN